MGITLCIVPTASTETANSSFHFFVSLSSGAGGLVSAFSMHLCIPHRGNRQQAFSRGNLWPLTDGGLDSAHYTSLVVDVSLVLLCGMQFSGRL